MNVHHDADVQFQHFIHQVMKENPDKPVTEIYGAIHLLRLFGKFRSSLLLRFVHVL